MEESGLVLLVNDSKPFSKQCNHYMQYRPSLTVSPYTFTSSNDLFRFSVKEKLVVVALKPTDIIIFVKVVMTSDA